MPTSHPFNAHLKPNGFTLLEILIALGIIAIVSVGLVSSIVAAQRSARDSQRKTDLKIIQLALEQYYIDHNYYPAEMKLDTLVQIDACTGAVGTCDITRVYLSTVPKEYFQILARNKTPQDIGTSDRVHYCYRAEATATSTSWCDNTANMCHFYHLFAILENSTGPTLGCIDRTAGFSHPDNYEVTPTN